MPTGWFDTRALGLSGDIHSVTTCWLWLYCCY